MKNHKIISHRGNLTGPNPELENSEDYILKSLSLGYDVEVDIWFIDENIFLGHDRPQYKTNINFIEKNGIWIHCKNIEALFFCIKNKIKNNYFFHNIDDAVLTSNNFIWTYPGRKLTDKSIAVMPELASDWDLSDCFAICSDYVKDIL